MLMNREGFASEPIGPDSRTAKWAGSTSRAASRRARSSRLETPGRRPSRQGGAQSGPWLSRAKSSTCCGESVATGVEITGRRVAAVRVAFGRSRGVTTWDVGRTFVGAVTGDGEAATTWGEAGAVGTLQDTRSGARKARRQMGVFIVDCIFVHKCGMYSGIARFSSSLGWIRRKLRCQRCRWGTRCREIAPPDSLRSMLDGLAA